MTTEAERLAALSPLSRAVNTVLWKDWDPIGCGVPEDEYASYAGPVAQLLKDGHGAIEIADYLDGVIRERMGLTRDRGSSLEIAERLRGHYQEGLLK